VLKVIRAADPAHAEKIDFFHGLRLSTLRLEHVLGPLMGQKPSLCRFEPPWRAFLRFGGLAFVRFVAKSFKPRAG
jgi:hypothetical protein